MTSENNNSSPILEMINITKKFGNFYALKDINLSLYPGEVHALMGENGAGKSTLMKILAGAYTANSGKIIINNKIISNLSPNYAIQVGISLIYQEIHLSPNLTVAENIFLGRELKNIFGLDRKKMEYESQLVLNHLGANFYSSQKVSTLTIAEQQQVEIARAIYRKSRILIMDEPTAALSSRETEHLFYLIKKLRNEGIAIIYISHRMAEIYELADRVSVLRDGKYVGSIVRSQLDANILIQMMVGRPLTNLFNKEKILIGEKILEVKNLSDDHKVKNVSLNIHAGEIVGLAGLVGSGRSEISHLLFGIKKPAKGEIYLKGKKIEFNSPRDAIKNHIALLPENRKEEGLFLDMNIIKNITISTLEENSKLMIINQKKGIKQTKNSIKSLNIRAPNTNINVSGLSGGNQQKVLISRWMAIKPDLFILDEPTRGVDVGAKCEIYKIITEMAKKGVAILIISSELPEIIGMSDRVYVMKEHQIVGELKEHNINQENIMSLACGVSN